MAWDTCRRGADPQPWGLHRANFGVDELDFNRSDSLTTRLELNMDLETPLSPIEEEAPSETSNPPLQVKLTLRFHDPVVRSVFHRTYSSSPSFVPTDRICQGLLRRVQHCSEELITRKDSAALTPAQCLRKGPKVLRFEMTFQIFRRGYSEVWAERAFKSYQKQPLTSDSAMDFLRSTHSIIGVFLKRHDHLFQWIDEPSHEYFPDKPATFKPSLTGPLNLACVPRSRFIESIQKWEVLPGYTLELTLESRNSSRRRPIIRRILKVNSTQTAPLNLGLGEDLLWQAYRAVEDALDPIKHAFDIEHATCEGFDGVPDCGCQHYDENALRVELRSLNNLGPIYEHLCRNIQSRLQLFKHPIGQDCDEFLDAIRARFYQLRDRTDEKLDLLNDFDFRIAELIGHGWHVKDAARFIIDGKQSYTRRSIEALLDRIRTGVGDVLRGHDVAIRMIAFKRGHLILDKALIARNHQSSPDHISSETSENEQKLFVAQLTERIQKDIDMICKDTCNVEDIPEAALEHKRQVRLRTVSSRPFTPRSVSSQNSSYTPPGSPGLFTRPPIPPCIPSRSSSIRVFPLVPARYKDKEERPSSPASSARDSATCMDLDSDYHDLGGASESDLESSDLESSANVRVPRVIVEDHRKDAAHGEGSCGLKPAAELKRAQEVTHDSSSSILTYSSMPALTESETPSPGQSILITPDCVRDSSQPGSLHFLNQMDSSPWLMAMPDPNIGHYPESEPLTGPKAAALKPSAIPLGRSYTPLNEDAQDLASPNTPKAFRIPEAAGATADTRPSQEARQAPQSHTGPQVGLAGDMNLNSVLHDIIAPDAGAASVDVAAAISSEVIQEQALPIEGWLRHCDEAMDEDDRGEVKGINSVEETELSGALQPSLEETVTEQGLENALSGQQTHVRPASEQVDQQALPELSRGEGDVQSSGPTESPVSIWPVVSNKVGAGNEVTYGNNVSDLPMEGMPLSIVNNYQDSEDSSEPEISQHDCPLGIYVSTEMDLRRISVAEVPEITYTIPSSDPVADARQGSEANEVSGSEFEEHMMLGRTEESAPEAPLDVSGLVFSGPETCATEPEVTSESSDVKNSPDGTEIDLETTVRTPNGSIDVPESLVDAITNDSASAADQVITSVPIIPPESVASSEVTSPMMRRRGSTHSELSPSLPAHSDLRNETRRRFAVSSRLVTGINQSSNSLSTSSEWEDCVSEPRQSIDSVDTVMPSSSLLEADDDLPQQPQYTGSAKRFGTPTAGLLGLHESLWANFGIRDALTGTHAFSRDSTANSPHSQPQKACYNHVELKNNELEAGVKMSQARSSSSHQRLIHLRHKKSTSSVNFPGAHIKLPKLNKRESKELKGRERTKPKAENSSPAVAVNEADAGRFPRAMALVAGLALVSSVVNKSSV